MARRDAGDGEAGALDPALTQKKRARRRLVGALVLGLAAVIVLPLVLDSEPRQTIADVQIEIPPRDTPLPPKTEDAPARAGEAVAVPPSLPAPPPLEAAPKPPDEPKPAAKVQTPAKALETAKVQTPAKVVEAPKAIPPAAKPAAAAPSAAAATPARDDARFVLQVGAFANSGSARAQADKARKAGVRAYTETVQTAQGERTRVRVGPFASREAADQARARLKAIGVDAALVPL
jgi:DedD protein